MAESPKKIVNKDLCYKCFPDPQVNEPKICKCVNNVYIRADIVEVMAERLRAAADQFSLYEKNNISAGKEHKAKTNRKYADAMLEALKAYHEAKNVGENK